MTEYSEFFKKPSELVTEYFEFFKNRQNNTRSGRKSAANVLFACAFFGTFFGTSFFLALFLALPITSQPGRTTPLGLGGAVESTCDHI